MSFPPRILLRRPLLGAVVLAILCAPPAGTQEEGAGPSTGPAMSATALRLDLSRQNLKNFLTEKEAFAPYRSFDGKTLDLREVFTLGSAAAGSAIFWDPATCRLVGVLDLEAADEPASETETGEDKEDGGEPPSPYLYKASGPHPLSGTDGATTTMAYFGFRLVAGQPEFLYQSGSLQIEERLWLEDGGAVMRQRYALPNARGKITITVPEAWKDRVESSTGSWRGTTLTVPSDSASEVVLTYRLARPDPDDTASPTVN